MERLRTLALALLVLAAAVYAGVKAYVYFGVRDQLDHAAARLHPFAALTYQGIASGIQGSVSVEGIEIRLPNRVLPIRIGSLTLEGPGPGFLFDAAAGFGPNRIPTRMRLTLDHVELPDPRDLSPGRLVSTTTDPCSLSGLLQRVLDLQSEQLPVVLDLSLRYQVDLLSGAGSASFQYKTAQGDALGVDMMMSHVATPDAMLRGAAPRLDNLRLVVQPDRQRVRGLVSRCAASSGLTASAFVGALLARPAPKLAADLGFLPGPGLRRALYLLVSGAGQAVVEVGPVDDPLQLEADAPGLSPAQLVSRLALHLSVGGEDINDLSFRQLADVDTGAASATATTPSAAPPPGGHPVAHFLVTPKTALSAYRGYRVRIFSRNRDRPYLGRLVDLNKGQLAVEQRLMGGEMTAYVPTDDVLRVEVLRLPDDDGRR